METKFYTDGTGTYTSNKGDVDNSSSYEAGAYWKDYERVVARDNSKLLLVPMDHRTVADFTDNESFRYEGNDGGMSWSTPWLAGMYVLAKQADPDITPEKFWQLALMSSDECNNNDDWKTVGRIVNPKKLIEKVEEYKGKEIESEVFQGTKINQETKYKNNEELGLIERVKISNERREEILRQNAKELYNIYGNDYNIYVDVNEYGDVDWNVEHKKI